MLLYIPVLKQPTSFFGLKQCADRSQMPQCPAYNHRPVAKELRREARPPPLQSSKRAPLWPKKKLPPPSYRDFVLEARRAAAAAASPIRHRGGTRRWRAIRCHPARGRGRRGSRYLEVVLGFALSVQHASCARSERQKSDFIFLNGSCRSTMNLKLKHAQWMG